jgi:predicted nuclease of restriction endonuclease-like (RecB) superfamily
VQGFSARNIWYMRSFYSTYADKAILQPLVAEIGWTHNLIVLDRCKDDLEREFYIRMARKFGWIKNVLIHHIENQSYEKTLLGQTNFDKTFPAEIQAKAKLAIKDEYTFDKEYFIDLLLFHRQLKCLVAVKLKITDFRPEYVGKMQFYLAALDDLVRLPDENPSIGIILCKTKDRVIVEYALRYAGKPIGVSEYQIVKRLPKALKGQLPTPEQISALLKDVE